MQNTTLPREPWIKITFDKELDIIDISIPANVKSPLSRIESIIGVNVRELSQIGIDQDNICVTKVIAENIQKAANTNDIVYFEFSITQDDNSVSYSICFAKREEDGNIYLDIIRVDEKELFSGRLGFSSYITDVTLNNINVGVYMSHLSNDGTKRYVIFNEKAKAIYGCDDVLQSPFWDQKEDDIYDEEIMNSDGLVRFEKGFYDDDSRIRNWLVFYKKKLRSRAKGSYIITTIIDISQKKVDSIKLEQQISLLESMYQNLPIGIVIFNPKGQILTTNSRVFEIIGISEDTDYSEKCIFDDPIFSDEVRQNLQNGIQSKFEICFNRDRMFGRESSSKNDKILRVSIYPIFDKQGLLENFLELCEDITESVVRQRELEEAQKNLSLALSAGKTIVWKYDVNTKTFYTFLSKNLLGTHTMNSEEADSILHPEDIPIMKQAFNNIISGKSKKQSITIRLYYSQDGSYHYYLSEMEGDCDENGKVSNIVGAQHDITADVTQKMELEKNREELSLALEAGNLSAWIYIFKDKTFYTLYGQAVAGNRLTLIDFYNSIHPDDAAAMNIFIAEMESGRKERQKMTIRFKSKNGGDYRYLDSTMMLKKVNNIPISITGTQKDITDWITLNKEVQQQNKINQLILNNINSGLLFINNDCTIGWSNLLDFKTLMDSFDIKSVNKGDYCNFYGECGGKFICKNPDHCFVKQAMKKGTIYKKNILANNRCIEAISIPVSDESGKMVGALLKIDDITERENLYSEITKAKEDALASNQILNIVLDRIPCALFIKDASDNFRYTTANKKFCETIGKKESDILGKTDYDIFDKSFADKTRFYDLELARGKQFVSYNSTFSSHDKTIDWIIYKSVILSVGGSLLILSIAADVSELYQANIALSEAQKKAEQSDKLKSAFLANMSHEIRTPLNAIVGFSDLLAVTDNPEEKKEYCKIISSNSDVLLRLIGDILDLSKIEAGLIDYKHERVNISSFFQELMISLKHKATNPEVDFIVDNPYKECYVYLDRNRFSQVISNFVSNAIKYTPSGYIKAGYNIVDNGLKVYVEDTGIGIPENKKDRIFHRFEKLNSFAQGTGLGLSIAKAIAESDGGKIGFESEEGSGSTFWMWLPMNNVTIPSQVSLSQGTELSNTPSPVKKSAVHSILVAEDNDSNFFLLKSILKDYDITRAINGADAVEKAVKKKYDIILMDIKMPVMDGLEATRRIKAFDKNVYIIAVTANAFISDREAAHNAGCDDFLAKPVKKDEIIDAISKKLA